MRSQKRPPLIEGLMNADGSGWIAGEEKLGKTYYALALALGQPVLGRFAVPARLRVVFIEEEDPPRRAHARVRAPLRGYGLDPDDPDLRRELNAWFRIEVWSGFTLDASVWLERLDATCAQFRPAVIYFDVLRKITKKDINKLDQASEILEALDNLRRHYGVIARLLHHNRKGQGPRMGRGSQELAGSYALGAWGECSLFFEPVGRKHDAVKIAVQVKDGAPLPPFRMHFYTEGPKHAPTLVRLTAEDEREDASTDDVLAQAIAAAPTTEAMVGRAGASIATLAVTLRRSDKTIRRGMKRLLEAKVAVVCGKAAKGTDLYAIAE